MPTCGSPARRPAEISRRLRLPRPSRRRTPDTSASSTSCAFVRAKEEGRPTAGRPFGSVFDDSDSLANSHREAFIRRPFLNAHKECWAFWPDLICGSLKRIDQGDDRLFRPKIRVLREHFLG